MTHQIDVVDEGNGSWLPLTEFSVRSGISTSTIRRKIKSNTIRYRLEEGRYLIFYDQRGDLPPREIPKVQETFEAPAPAPAPRVVAAPPPPPKEKKVERVHAENALQVAALPFIERAVKMVSDAFDQTLKEKDERIRLLENRNLELIERLNELRTLVQALEEKYEVRY